MKIHGHLPKRAWMLPIVIIAIIVIHVTLPYVLSRSGFFSHSALPLGLVSVVVVLVVVKHLEVLGSLYALLRRRS